jgi:hypothetical protein
MTVEDGGNYLKIRTPHILHTKPYDSRRYED